MLYVWLGFSVVTAIAAHSRGRSPAAWLALGIIFGFFALLAVLVMRPLEADADAGPDPIGSGERTRCPQCSQVILAKAMACKHCGAKVAPTA